MIDEAAIAEIGGVTFTDNEGGHAALIEFCVATQQFGDGDEPPPEEARAAETVRLLNDFPDLVSGLAASRVDVETAAEALFEMARRPGRRRRRR